MKITWIWTNLKKLYKCPFNYVIILNLEQEFEEDEDEQLQKAIIESQKEFENQQKSQPPKKLSKAFKLAPLENTPQLLK